MWTLPDTLTIVEVGPRDGLQNEPVALTPAQKVAFIRGLWEAGLRHIEAGAFVRADRVPQMADSDTVLAQLGLPPDGVCLSALVPNQKGLERALAAGLGHIAVFTAASETFTQRNINQSIAASLAGFATWLPQAQAAGLRVRGYVSTAFVCPYEGRVLPAQVAPIVEALLAMGVYEVSLGDTIGAAAPRDIMALLDTLLARGIAPAQLALHCHDTYGRALANVMAGMAMGVATVDTSAGGLGGCPYAPGASGNLATEVLVSFCQAQGIATGVDMARLAQAIANVAQALDKPLRPAPWWP
jgi:hydroxymethylglutaryl-CoA lyase